MNILCVCEKEIEIEGEIPGKHEVTANILAFGVPPRWAVIVNYIEYVG